MHAKHIDMLIKEPRVLLITTVLSELCLHACLRPACALHDITRIDYAATLCVSSLRMFRATITKWNSLRRNVVSTGRKRTRFYVRRA